MTLLADRPDCLQYVDCLSTPAFQKCPDHCLGQARLANRQIGHIAVLGIVGERRLSAFQLDASKNSGV